MHLLTHVSSLDGTIINFKSVWVSHSQSNTWIWLQSCVFGLLLALLGASWKQKLSPCVGSMWTQGFQSFMIWYLPFPVAQLGLTPALFFSCTGSAPPVHLFMHLILCWDGGRWAYGGSCLWRIAHNSNSRPAGGEAASCLLKSTLFPPNQPQAEGLHSWECQKTWGVSDLHQDWHFRQNGSLCLGDITAEFDSSW